MHRWLVLQFELMVTALEPRTPTHTPASPTSTRQQSSPRPTPKSNVPLKHSPRKLQNKPLRLHATQKPPCWRSSSKRVWPRKPSVSYRAPVLLSSGVNLPERRPRRRSHRRWMKTSCRRHSPLKLSSHLRRNRYPEHGLCARRPLSRLFPLGLPHLLPQPRASCE
jgi:hypothetical protein